MSIRCQLYYVTRAKLWDLFLFLLYKTQRLDYIEYKKSFELFS
jgi:hypothetical protein